MGRGRRPVPFLLTASLVPTFNWSKVMREGMCFRAGRALTAVSAAATLFVFGAGDVRAQTAPGLAAAIITPPAGAQPQTGTRRLSIQEAVALALEQNVDLQVD